MSIQEQQNPIEDKYATTNCHEHAHAHDFDDTQDS